MVKRLLVFAGLWVLSHAQEPFSLINEISFSDLDDNISPIHISFIGENKFVILDSESQEIMLIDKNNIINRSGGFGQGVESFSEPSDMIVQNLKVWICDRTENLIQQFDYSLNYIGVELLDNTITDPFYSDILIENPFGNPYIFSKTYGEVWSLDESNWPYIDLNQYGMDGKCIIDISADDFGNIAFLTCDNEIMMFNRFGRLMKRVKVEMIDPVFILNLNLHWLVLNGKGMVSDIDGDLLQNIELRNHEIIYDVDASLQHLTILTNERILVYK
ncbi:MAG: hypothetical protein IIB45_04895 [Candidatus Marinimicrobia bacterium]|nr:hypothetical protein [Candidatus Neomarinimicrobiota bacterium]